MTFISFVLISLVAAGPILSYEATSSETKTFDLKPDGDVIIICDDGFIHVKTWNKDEVKMVMTKGARANTKANAMEKLERIELDIEHASSRLYVREVQSREDNQFSFWDLFDPDQWSRLNNSTWIDFELTVPVQCNLRLETDEGDIEVSRLKGNIEIETDEGDVELNAIEFDDMIVTLDEGDLYCSELSAPDGRVNIETDEGRVRIENADLDKLMVECDEGDVSIRKLRARIIDVDSDEGDLEFEFEMTSNGRYGIFTDEGDVEILIPSSSSAELTLETDDGRIRTDFGLAIDRGDDGERVREVIGRGDARLEVYSDDGNISLEKR
jgi:hypothetical protein